MQVLYPTGSVLFTNFRNSEFICYFSPFFPGAFGSMDSGFDHSLLFRDGVEETGDHRETSPCDSRGGKSDSASVLSHVEALVDACFPENLQWSGGSIGSGSATNRGCDQRNDLRHAAGAKSETVSEANVADGSSEAAHGTKRKLSAVDVGKVGSDLGGVATVVPSEICFAENRPNAEMTAASEGMSCAKSATAQDHPTSSSGGKDDEDMLDGVPVPGAVALQRENPMTVAVTDFLLEEARQAASDSKLELRKALKADLERLKSDLSLADRSKMRSRREAAVSRENRIAYTKRLEELVLNLVRGNLQLIGNQDIGVSRIAPRVESGVDARAATKAQPACADSLNPTEAAP